MATPDPNKPDWGALNEREVFQRLEEMDTGTTPLPEIPRESVKPAPEVGIFRPDDGADHPPVAAQVASGVPGNVTASVATQQESAKLFGGDDEKDMLRDLRDDMRLLRQIIENWDSGD